MPIIPATWEAEIRRIMVRGQPWQKKLARSQPTSRAWRYMPVIPATWEAQVAGSWSEASPRQKCETLSKK
jgi:hypothetical protein